MAFCRSILLVTCCLCFTGGCVQMHPTRSGFISDYADMISVDKHDAVRVKPVNGEELAAIDSFYIEPVQWLADDLGQPASSEKLRIAMSNAFQAALTDELGKVRPVVSEIGPNTAIVRAAVTGVQESKPFANLFLAVQIAGPLFNGGASVELEMLTADGRQITAESAGYHGYEWDVFGYFWRPSHTKTALRKAARTLACELATTDGHR